MMAPMKLILVRQEVKLSGISSIVTTRGSAELLVGLGATLERVSGRRIEFVGDSWSLLPTTPISQGSSIEWSDTGHGIDAFGARPVIPEDIVEQQGITEGRGTTG